MDQDTVRLISLAVAVIMTGIFLRRRYGNIYKALTDALERKTGLTMTSILRGLGVATVAVWLLIYLIMGGREEEGLDQLFRGLFQAPSGEPGTQ
jgi:hypothetical protein